MDGGEILLFANGTDVGTLAQSPRDTNFRFLSLRSANHTSYILGDSLTARSVTGKIQILQKK